MRFAPRIDLLPSLQHTLVFHSGVAEPPKRNNRRRGGGGARANDRPTAVPTAAAAAPQQQQQPLLLPLLLLNNYPQNMAPAADPFLAVAAQFAALAAACYAALFFLSAKLSPRLFPRAYGALSPGDRQDWCSRVPSTAHAVASVAWAAALVLGGAFGGQAAGSADPKASPRAGGPTAGAEPEGWPSLRACSSSYAALGLSAGYFGADAVAMVLFPAIGSLPIYAHHFVALASLAAAAAARGAHAPVLAVLASEATTPLVNARFWLDRCGGGRRGWLYAANGLALALAWFVCREAAFVGYFWWLRRAWPGVRAAALPLYARAMLCGVPALLLALNTLWFVKIVKGARKMWRPFCDGLVAFFGRRFGGEGIKAGREAAARRRPSGVGGGGVLGVGATAHASATITTARPAGDEAGGGKALRHLHQVAAGGGGTLFID